jgi:hypothetical protein
MVEHGVIETVTQGWSSFTPLILRRLRKELSIRLYVKSHGTIVKPYKNLAHLPILLSARNVYRHCTSQHVSRVYMSLPIDLAQVLTVI